MASKAAYSFGYPRLEQIITEWPAITGVIAFAPVNRHLRFGPHSANGRRSAESDAISVILSPAAAAAACRRRAGPVRTDISLTHQCTPPAARPGSIPDGQCAAVGCLVLIRADRRPRPVVTTVVTAVAAETDVHIPAQPVGPIRPHVLISH